MKSEYKYKIGAIVRTDFMGDHITYGLSFIVEDRRHDEDGNRYLCGCAWWREDDIFLTDEVLRKWQEDANTLRDDLEEIAAGADFKAFKLREMAQAALEKTPRRM